jgi:hypothetical protein
MRLPSLAALGVAVGAAILGVYFLQERRSLKPSAKLSVPENYGQEASLARDMDNLKREVAVLKLDRLAPSALNANQSDTAPRTEPTISPGPEELQAKYTERNRLYKQQLEGTFRRQYRDAGWAAETEQRIEAVVSTVGPGTTVTSVACAATMCKVVVTHDDDLIQKQLARMVAQKEPFQYGTFYSYDGLTTTMFLIREGQAFPHAEE